MVNKGLIINSVNQHGEKDNKESKSIFYHYYTYYIYLPLPTINIYILYNTLPSIMRQDTRDGRKWSVFLYHSFLILERVERLTIHLPLNPRTGCVF